MAEIQKLTLYSYYYSSASWRIRSVLALKNIPFVYEGVPLLDGAQYNEKFVAINPMHQVPALRVDFKDGQSHILTQSLAIIHFLEDKYPEKPIFPKDAVLKAKALAIADTISGGIQPLQNLETLVQYKNALGLEGEMKPEERKTVAQFWLNRKFESLEKLVKTTAGDYCVGNEVTVADVCLVPQMFNCRRFEIDTSKFPTLKAIDERLQKLDIFKTSHPLACPDAPKQ